MKARPLYRSLTFWLGVPGLLFLLWTWRDSLTHEAGVFRRIWYSQPGHLVTGMDDMIGYRFGGFWVTHYSFQPGPLGSVSREPVEMKREELPTGLRSVRAAPRFDWKTPTTELDLHGIYVTGISIPHWLALTLYLAAWGGAMGWRQTRIRRAGKQLLTSS